MHVSFCVQILSRLDIIIPMHLLLRIFKVGVERIEFASTGSGDLQTSHQPSVLQTTSLTSRVGVAPMSPQKLPDVPDPMVLYDRETQLVLPCFTMMLDMVLRQVSLYHGHLHCQVLVVTFFQLFASRLLVGLLGVSSLHTFYPNFMWYFTIFKQSYIILFVH